MCAKRISRGLRVKRQSFDSRRRGGVRLVYTVHVTLHDAQRQRVLEERFGAVQAYAPPEIEYGDLSPGRPVVVGAGAGRPVRGAHTRAARL